MATHRFEPSSIKNKVKREKVARKNKKNKRQDKLQKRLARVKVEANDPLVKKKRLEKNVPRTLDNAREFDPSLLPAEPQLDPSSSDSKQRPVNESALDVSSDPFASYFSLACNLDPSKSPKVLITTSFKASKFTYDFCDELVSVMPGAEFIRRKKGKRFEMGRVAVWAAERDYTNMIVVNEGMKKPNAVTFIHLPEGPSAYFKLSSVQLTKQINGHARATEHFPELILNNFVTRLGHTVGRMFQTLFPPMPEFQGRQVVTLHNQRDFLFFRRHRYAFRSTDKAALQEIGPRFTLKLRWMKKGTPAVQSLGQPSKPLEITQDEDGREDEEPSGHSQGDYARDESNENSIPAEVEPLAEPRKKIVPPTKDEYIWMWKPELEATRRTFFL